MRIGTAAIVATVCAWAATAGEATIDLTKYRNAKKYTYSEVTHTVGTHQYTLVNIRPRAKGDTACIAALVIDKRKFVMVDLQADSARTGLTMPKEQPIEGGLVVVKLSPLEAKTFIILATGKVVTLPGDRLIVDPAGKTALAIWDNAGTWQLTALDYRSMNLVLPTTAIPRPVKWYTNGLAYYFTADGEEGYCTLDMFTKTVSRVKEALQGLEEVAYTFDPQGIAPVKCCGADALKPQAARQ